jgi:hypothetical protein
MYICNLIKAGSVDTAMWKTQADYVENISEFKNVFVLVALIFQA